MKQIFQGWAQVAARLDALARDEARKAEGGGGAAWLNEGQRASVRRVAERIAHNGMIVADEVGMGKTRIAAALARAVTDSGGRVAVLVPPGLGYQWRAELLEAGVTAPPLLRSLRQYLAAWEADDPSQAQPWFDQHAVVLSHAFANWKLGAKSEPWRWALLPQLYAKWRKHGDWNGSDRLPRGYRDNEKLTDWQPEQAALSIVQAAKGASDALARRLIGELAEQTPWPGALYAEAYRRDEHLRPWLERAVGLGLGIFDLIIVDEAHKSRKRESILSGLLDRVALTGESTRRLSLTATPVELDVQQWKGILSRTGVATDSLADAIEGYDNAVTRVRQTPFNDEVRRTYRDAAVQFESALSPYLLRRDKREDEHVKAFARYAETEPHAYRRESEITIDTASLKPAWKQAVCAAEALSIVAGQPGQQGEKRLRLTIGNGHGIAALIRDESCDESCDYVPTLPEDEGRDAGETEAEDAVAQAKSDKAVLRAGWWRRVLAGAIRSAGAGLYEHPAIQAAVAAIEEVTAKGEKVLVFGRFTAPMQQLVNLLNARAMLRSLDQGTLWPQAKIQDDEWPAIQAAHVQLQQPGELRREDLDAALAKQYQDLEQQRRRYRDRLLAHIDAGLTACPDNVRARRLFEAFRQSVAADGQVPGRQRQSLGSVAKAMRELLGAEAETLGPKEFAAAFIELISASAERDEGDADGDGVLDEEEATKLWQELERRLDEEYSRPEGGFARLMYGETKLETRRFLQLAFNRENSYPKVLVAQSMVGREGLNLHKACRTVVLLHPEWNPGVVEQQIGRVDRVGSLWERCLDEAIQQALPAADLPRIEIRPVVFKGTYDEKNWQVLRERWDDLRAQLHGVVISPLLANASAVPRSIVDEINGVAPSFSPLPRTSRN